MAKRIYKEDEIQTALALYKGGASLRDIADTLGCAVATVHYWVKKSKRQSDNKEDVPTPTTKEQDASINKLLLNMACGNDLSKWVGRSITSLQPREIYEFLKAINLQGELKSTQIIKI